jgi:hypothetical protein
VLSLVADNVTASVHGRVGQTYIQYSICNVIGRFLPEVFPRMPHLKGSVQRKLRWVENGVNRSVGASDCGAGHSFVVLFGFHLGFAIFPFPVSTARIISEFWINR